MTDKKMPAFRIIFRTRDKQKFDCATVWPGSSRQLRHFARPRVERRPVSEDGASRSATARGE